MNIHDFLRRAHRLWWNSGLERHQFHNAMKAVPRGIVLPWLLDGQLWQIKVRTNREHLSTTPGTIQFTCWPLASARWRSSGSDWRAYEQRRPRRGEGQDDLLVRRRSDQPEPAPVEGMDGSPRPIRSAAELRKK